MPRGAHVLRPSRQRSGQGLTEYALVLAAIATVTVVAVRLFGQQLNEFYVHHILPWIP